MRTNRHHFGKAERNCAQRGSFNETSRNHCHGGTGPRVVAEGERRRSAPFRLRLGTAGVIILVAALYLTPTVFDRYLFANILPYLPGSSVPPRGVEASDAPLGVPPATTGSTQYVLQESPVASQEFVAYDPCQPVHSVVRPDFASLPGRPPTGESDRAGLALLGTGPCVPQL